MSAPHDDDWPDVLEEREPTNDVEAIDERLREQGVTVKSKLEGTITADLEPGDRLRLHWRELEVEMGAGGIASLLVEGVPVWSGPIAEIRDIHTYSSSIDKTLCGVAINGKVVWIRALPEE